MDYVTNGRSPECAAQQEFEMKPVVFLGQPQTRNESLTKSRIVVVAQSRRDVNLRKVENALGKSGYVEIRNIAVAYQQSPRCIGLCMIGENLHPGDDIGPVGYVVEGCHVQPVAVDAIFEVLQQQGIRYAPGIR